MSNGQPSRGIPPSDDSFPLPLVVADFERSLFTEATPESLARAGMIEVVTLNCGHIVPWRPGLPRAGTTVDDLSRLPARFFTMHAEITVNPITRLPTAHQRPVPAFGCPECEERWARTAPTTS